MSAKPDPVAPGARLTLTLKPVASAAAPAPGVTVHLSPGVADIQAAGSGWICEQIPADKDDYQPAAHVDLRCTNAGAMLGTPPLTVTLTAPLGVGTIRTCAVPMGKGASPGTPACVDTRVGS